MKKRIVTMLLALVLVVSLVPVAAMADGCDCDKLTVIATGAYTVQSNDNGTHSMLCNAHGAAINVLPCDATEEKACSVCGYTKPAAEPDAPECKHEYSYAPLGGGQHKKFCRLCDSMWANAVTENCALGVDGKCIYCEGGKVSEPEDPKPEESKPEETEPEETEPKECACGLGDGKHAEYIGDGKHAITCEHGKVVNTTWCTKGSDGKCTACGHVMEEEPTTPDVPEDPTTPNKPTTPSTPETPTTPAAPSTSDKGLDNVPKTGDNGSIIAITFMTVLAVFGGAYLFTTKRAF